MDFGDFTLEQVARSLGVTTREGDLFPESGKARRAGLAARDAGQADATILEIIARAQPLAS